LGTNTKKSSKLPECKKNVNRDKMDFATKQRMLGPLIIIEVPSLSMTDGRAVAHVLLP